MPRGGRAHRSPMTRLAHTRISRRAERFASAGDRVAGISSHGASQTRRIHSLWRRRRRGRPRRRPTPRRHRGRAARTGRGVTSMSVRATSFRGGWSGWRPRRGRRPRRCRPRTGRPAGPWPGRHRRACPARRRWPGPMRGWPPAADRRRDRRGDRQWRRGRHLEPGRDRGAGRDAVEVGFLNDGGERLQGGAAGFEEARKVRALAQLRDRQVEPTETGFPAALAVTIAVVGGLGAAHAGGCAGQRVDLGVAGLLDPLHQGHLVASGVCCRRSLRDRIGALAARRSVIVVSGRFMCGNTNLDRRPAMAARATGRALRSA